MINISDKILCKSCFSEISSEPCPKCGFAETSYAPELTVLPCGSVLQGRYAIGRVIGKGGFGITYLAYDIKLDRKIAVKEYFPRTLAYTEAPIRQRSPFTARATLKRLKTARKNFTPRRVSLQNSTEVRQL